MIVVSILGILAAIVLPEFQNHTQKAKESSAKDNLRILRTTIERYAIDHNGSHPGYLNGDTSIPPIENYFMLHMLYYSDKIGNSSAAINPAYPYGPYLNEIPVNPFNDSNRVWIILDGDSFPTDPPDNYGWCYKPQTKELKISTKGTDSEGNEIYDY